MWIENDTIVQLKNVHKCPPYIKMFEIFTRHTPQINNVYMVRINNVIKMYFNSLVKSNNIYCDELLKLKRQLRE